MKTWYAAHVIMYFRLKGRRQRRFDAWENIILVSASSPDEAYAFAEKHGRSEEGDCDGTLTVAGKPAELVFGGVRTLVECVDPDRRPTSGTEVTYLDLSFDGFEALEAYCSGETTHPWIMESKRRV